MSRCQTGRCISSRGFPRLRGDEPNELATAFDEVEFSPPTRG